MTKNLNKAVARNNERFPHDFMFQLNKEEYDSLRFQTGTLKKGQHSKYLPHVFTEYAIREIVTYEEKPKKRIGFRADE